MVRFEDHRRASWSKYRINGVEYLCCQLLARLEAPSEYVDHSRQLGKPDGTTGRQIGDMGPSEKRRHAAFATGREWDVSDENEIIIAIDLVERSAEKCQGILVIAGVEFGVDPRDPLGRANQTRSIRVVAGPANEGTNGGLRVLAVRTVWQAVGVVGG